MIEFVLALPPQGNLQEMITVIDAVMGSGKTTHIIKHINETYQQDLKANFDRGQRPTKFLVVTPLLSEVERFRSSCPMLDFRDPQPIEGRKLHHLETLVREGRNIVSTHALFRLLNRDIFRLLQDENYVLILDEVLDCVQIFKTLTKADKDLLFDQRLVYVDPETKRLGWNMRDHSAYSGRFSAIKELCRNGNLVCRNGTVLLWEFPVEFLECFSDIIILTYMFHGSPMSAHLKAAGL
ncbi:MAG: DEAD/DEAH box helicase family protein, partial [Lentilitoribacter sp.]